LLPQAEIAFLDEIFKANSAILNTLLSITNERLFYNLGQAFKVNLAFVVGASNETPDEELGALFDRFPIRVPCRPVAQAHLKDVIKKAHGFDCARELHDEKHKIKRVACLNDLRLLAKIVQGGICGGTEAFGDAQFEEDFTKLLMTIRQDYGVSDRTPAQILRLCRALALLDSDGGDPQIKGEHLRAWGYVAPKFAAARDLQQLVKARILQLPGGAKSDLFDE
jgi:MoxR-like ATPase